MGICLRWFNNGQIRKIAKDGSLSARYVLSVRKLKKSEEIFSDRFRKEMEELFKSGFPSAGLTIGRSYEICGNNDMAMNWYHEATKLGVILGGGGMMNMLINKPGYIKLP